VISPSSPLGGPAPTWERARWDQWQRWLRAGTRLAATSIAALDEDTGHAPSLLPDWTRQDVLAHLALNAGAVLNLLTWARTGVPTPMYPNGAARAAHIREHAALPWDRLITEFHTSASRLAFTMARMPDHAWAARVRTASGREVPAREAVWLRVREVWVHTVDLDNGVGFSDFPPELVDALLDDATPVVGARLSAGAFTLAPTDRARRWPVGTSPTSTVSGPAADLLGWLTGRQTPTATVWSPAPPELPRLPPWL
jgi:maleylpyruvate isomerase